jgi:hypothetical protein
MKRKALLAAALAVLVTTLLAGAPSRVARAAEYYECTQNHSVWNEDTGFVEIHGVMVGCLRGPLKIWASAEVWYRDGGSQVIREIVPVSCYDTNCSFPRTDQRVCCQEGLYLVVTVYGNHDGYRDEKMKEWGPLYF